MTRLSHRQRRVAVVLGAGVARGWAHIGVLRELDAMGLRPQVVVGSSIGAVIGGCYAAGKLDGMEQFALSLTRRRVLGLLDISFNGGGLIGGERLRQRLEAAMSECRIEDLPVQFAAVATEIRTGHEVWLTSGRLVDAVRASYALPGVFEPVKIGGRWLFDGAIVNPIPVSVGRALGADAVIAVCITGDGPGRSGPGPASELSPQAAAEARDGAGPRRLHHPFPQWRGFDVSPAMGGRTRLGRAGSRHRHDQRLQHHRGPHHARAPGGRSARRHDQCEGRARSAFLSFTARPN